MVDNYDELTFKKFSPISNVDKYLYIYYCILLDLLARECHFFPSVIKLSLNTELVTLRYIQP